MARNILIGILGLAIALIGLGFALPDAAHVERSVVINAAPEKIYPLVSDLNAARDWQPWVRRDPAMQVKIVGAGVGQTQTWASEKLGDGKQTIAALDPPSRVDYALDFGDMGRATSSVLLTPAEGGVKVVWTLDTKMREGVPVYMQPISTYMGFFMDQMVGKDYEEGLANLKAAAEQG